MLARRTRLLIFGGIITIVFIGVMILNSPEPTRTVDEIMKSPESYEGKELAIRGEVLDGSIDNETLTFTLHGLNEQIIIDFSSASVSNGLDDNRTVYAKGILVYDGGKYIFEADIIKTSCPSKYEE